MPALLIEPELRRPTEAYMYALYTVNSTDINAVGRSEGFPVHAGVASLVIRVVRCNLDEVR